MLLLLWFIRSCQSSRITDFRYSLSSAGFCNVSIYLCVRVCMYRCHFDCSHTIQPRALKLWHNIPHVCEKKNSRVIPFPIFLEDFSVTLKSNYPTTNGDRNEILFAHKLTGQRQTFKGKMFDRECPDFFLCLSSPRKKFFEVLPKFRFSPRFNKIGRITKIGTKDRYHE